MIKIKNQSLILLPDTFKPSQTFLEQIPRKYVPHLRVYFNPFTGAFSLDSKKPSKNDVQLVTISSLGMLFERNASLSEVGNWLGKEAGKRFLPALRARSLRATDFGLYEIMSDSLGLVHYMNPELSAKTLLSLGTRFNTPASIIKRAAKNFHYLPIRLQQKFYKGFDLLWPADILQALQQNVAEIFRPDQLVEPVSLVGHSGDDTLYRLRNADLFSEKPPVGNYHNSGHSSVGSWRQFSKEDLRNGFRHLSITIGGLGELNNFVSMSHDLHWKEALSEIAIDLDINLVRTLSEGELSSPGNSQRINPDLWTKNLQTAYKKGLDRLKQEQNLECDTINDFEIDR